MKVIKEFATAAPRTFAITVGWLLILAGLFTWSVIDKGVWWALLWLLVAVGVGVGLTALNRWAAKGDGIDR